MLANFYALNLAIYTWLIGWFEHFTRKVDPKI